MVTTERQTPRQYILLSFNPKNKKAIQFINTIKMMEFFVIEESPYNPQYVREIKNMDKRTFKSVKREDLWK